MLTFDSPFTVKEQQKIEELFEQSKFHRTERRRLILNLQPYWDWCADGKVVKMFSEEEIQSYNEMAVQAKEHFEEMYKYEMQLKLYRDWKNTQDYARQQAAEKAYAKKIALKCLQEDLPTETIARVTGLSEAAVMALRG